MTDNEIKEDCLQEAGIDLGRYSYNEMAQIKDALRRYHSAKLKLLSIADVSGRSEQLIDFAVKEGYFEGVPKGNLMGLIDRFEKSINCY
jgi:hypothetical protein